jgi:hypothetical protein
MVFFKSFSIASKTLAAKFLQERYGFEFNVKRLEDPSYQLG